MEPPLLTVLHSSKVLTCRKDLPIQHRLVLCSFCEAFYSKKTTCPFGLRDVIPLELSGKHCWSGPLEEAEMVCLPLKRHSGFPELQNK